MNQTEIERLAEEKYPKRECWYGTPPMLLDDNLRDRNVWIEGYKAGYTAAKDKGVIASTSTAEQYLIENNHDLWINNNMPIPEICEAMVNYANSIRPQKEDKGVGMNADINIAFLMWYSGMEEEQIMRAFNKWKREHPESSSPVADKEKLKELVEATLIIGARRGAGTGILTHDTAKKLIQQDIDGMTDRFIKLEKQTL